MTLVGFSRTYRAINDQAIIKVRGLPDIGCPTVETVLQYLQSTYFLHANIERCKMQRHKQKSKFMLAAVTVDLPLI